MKSAILIACFLPLVIIYIVMKLIVWLTATNAESTYVKKESLRPHGRIWQMRMQMLTKRNKSIGISQKIDSILFEWYS